MKPEVIRPRRIPWRRVLVAIVIAWAGWTASRVLEGLERADHRAAVRRGPVCTSTVYFPTPTCPCGAYAVEGTWWCRPWCRP